MSNDYNMYGAQSAVPVDRASDVARGAFIRKTYMHLFFAVLVFIGLEGMLLNSPLAEPIVSLVFARGMVGMLVVLALFMGSQHVANKMAMSATSIGMQYAGLGVGILAWTIMTLPMLYVAANFVGPTIIPAAGIITFALFAGVTGSVMISGKNFSFIGPFIGAAGMGALGLIVCAMVFGFELGMFFTFGMILLACGYLVYDTSRVMHEYSTTQYVAASLALFSSVAILFWYVLRFVMAMSRD